MTDHEVHEAPDPMERLLRASTRGTRALTFEEPGETYEGVVLSVETRHDTKFNSDDLAYDEEGNPKWVVVIMLEIGEPDPDDEEDDGTRVLWARSRLETAVGRALVQAGVRKKQDAVGGMLRVTYTGNGKPFRKGMSAPKLYTASFSPFEGEPGADVEPEGKKGAAAWAALADKARDEQDARPDYTGSVDDDIPFSEEQA